MHSVTHSKLLRKIILTEPDYVALVLYSLFWKLSGQAKLNTLLNENKQLVIVFIFYMN